MKKHEKNNARVIKKIRLKQQLSLAEMSTKLNISEKEIVDWENGKSLSLDDILHMGNTLNIRFVILDRSVNAIRLKMGKENISHIALLNLFFIIQSIMCLMFLPLLLEFYKMGTFLAYGSAYVEAYRYILISPFRETIIFLCIFILLNLIYFVKNMNLYFVEIF